MAQLFEITDKVVYPHAETLLLEPFKSIWERDTTKGKEIAIKEFAFMEFMTSVRKTNPYKGYSDEKREELLLKDIIQDPKWEKDSLILRGMAEIKRFQTEASATYAYYISVRKAVQEMQTFLDQIDLSERTKMGAPVYKPKELTSALIDTEKVLANLRSLETKVEEELFQETKNRANKTVSYFASIDSFKK